LKFIVDCLLVVHPFLFLGLDLTQDLVTSV